MSWMPLPQRSTIFFKPDKARDLDTLRGGLTPGDDNRNASVQNWEICKGRLETICLPEMKG